MAKFKMKDLNKYLSDKDSKSLINEIKTLVKLYPDVKKYFLSRINPESEKQIMETYRKKIYNEYFPERGFGKLRYSVMRKALNEFKKICRFPENMAELMVTYVEGGIEFTNTYGDIDEYFYDAVSKMHRDTLKYILDNNLPEIFDKRLKKIVTDGSGMGWGFSDELEENHSWYLKQKE